MGLSPPEVTSPLVARSLGMFIDTWKVLTGNLWVLQAVKGFKIPFVSLPSQDTMPTKPVSSRAGSSNEGAQITVGEGSNSPSDKQPGRFLLKTLLGNQEERSDDASNQPETVE